MVGPDDAHRVILEINKKYGEILSRVLFGANTSVFECYKCKEGQRGVINITSAPMA